ncbi:MAG TPA: alpha/beta fold hydrolase [Actinomycetota bacterium]|nr:alpha/beta fold hydrolase [Actinomycetota bacterium]
MHTTDHVSPGLSVTEHEFTVPLVHDSPDGRELTVFAREVVAAGRERKELPWLVFFQGGPGFEATRPLGPDDPVWLRTALKDHRVLLLDQRGTGRSTPVDRPLGKTAEEQAEYLANFRADAIVRDADLIRLELGVDRWTVLGQSFGGFCVVRYLSAAPEGLSAALITGGLPPLECHLDDVYRATYERVSQRNVAFYERYPEDRRRVRTIVERLEEDDVRLPSGDRLTPRRFRQLGVMLGMGDGFERLHFLLELPFASRAFLHDVDAAYPFARNPLYAVIHEACCATGYATRWSAERVMPERFRDDPTWFTGEHVYPWMLEEYESLRPFEAAARVLAEWEWPVLYDLDVLRGNEVPVAAAIYANDLYVERAFSEETARTIRGSRPWITNEFEHDGLRVAGDRILERLLDLVHNRA